MRLYLKRYDLIGYQLKGYNLIRYQLKGYKLIGYQLKGYNLIGYHLKRYNLVGYQPKGYNLIGYQLKGYNLIGYQLKGSFESIRCKSYSVPGGRPTMRCLRFLYVPFGHVTRDTTPPPPRPHTVTTSGNVTYMTLVACLTSTNPLHTQIHAHKQYVCNTHTYTYENTYQKNTSHAEKW